ncbi:MAG: sulfite exporter TauE/SafE family protein [Oscillospiraceae bacterium]|nr:sulfite exporter TauE/SafE family protein [Oscillospiraceae bacterium]
MSALLTAAVGAACGILSGFGIGGGSLLMVWLTAAVSVPQQTAQFWNLLYFLPTSLGALPFHAKNRQIAWRAVIPAALCGCAAAIGGAWLATAFDPGLLRKLFGGFLIIVGVREFFTNTQQ